MTVYGKVVGTFVYPDGPTERAASGTVKFMPQNVIDLDTQTVVREPVTVTLNSKGAVAAYLVPGLYRVVYKFANVELPTNDILVTGDHTELKPLSLNAAIPPLGAILNTTQYAKLSSRLDTVEKMVGPPGKPGPPGPPNTVAEEIAAQAQSAVAGKVGKGELVINVRDYGASGNGIADDTKAIQTALDAVPLTGGTVHFPAGKYVVSGGLTLSRPATLSGTGTGSYEPDSGGSRILCASPTATVLTVSVPAVVVSGLTFENTSSIRPTAGAALLATDFDWGRIERCMFIGFWNQVQIESGYFYSLRNNAFLRPVNFGCYMRNTAAGQYDHGDQVLEGNNFSKYGDPINGGTAVRWESGGGLRLIGNKVNAGTQPGYPTTGFWNNGFVTEIGATGAGSTSVHTVVGNSVEGFLFDGIKVAIAAAATSFGKITIVGNELLSSGSKATSVAIRLGMDTFIGGGFYVNNVTVIGNVAYGGCVGLKATGVERLVITGNSFFDCSGSALNLTRVISIIQRDNLFTTDIVDNDANVVIPGTGRARGVWEYKRDFAALTTNAFYGKVKPGQYSDGIITVKVYGNVSTVGSVRLQQSRVLSRVTGAVTVGAIVGADLTLGAAAEVSISLDVTTESGLCKVKVASVNGKSFTGVVEVIYDGVVELFSYAN